MDEWKSARQKIAWSPNVSMGARQLMHMESAGNVCMPGQYHKRAQNGAHRSSVSIER